MNDSEQIGRWVCGDPPASGDQAGEVVANATLLEVDHWAARLILRWGNNHRPPFSSILCCRMTASLIPLRLSWEEDLTCWQVMKAKRMPSGQSERSPRQRRR